MLELFTVEEYNPPKGFYGESSIRLLFRLIMRSKFSKYYFSKDLSDEFNNGCILFGVPDKWKGLLGIRFESEDSIKFVLDEFRVKIEEMYYREMFKALEGVLEHLRGISVISGYSVGKKFKQILEEEYEKTDN
jgi:hypothetical protein